MDFPNINPIFFSVGVFSVSYYSLSYVLGILLGWYYANRIIEQFSPAITKKNMDDFITFFVIGIIFGGRLGYVLFYDPKKYFANPIDILKTYEGGMSFHGAIIGIIITSYVFSKIHKVQFFTITDIISTVSPIGIFFGRIANFINGELYGRPTSMFWGVKFPHSDMLARHPSQIYEALLEGLALFLILFILTFRYETIKRRKCNSAVFLIIYSIFRMFIELFREADSQIGYIFSFITMGQILSLLMLFLGIYLITKLGRHGCR